MTNDMYEMEAAGTRNLRGTEPGMPVFDVGAVLLGTVAYAYDPIEPALWRVTDTLIAANVPVQGVARVQLEGCLIVDTGLFMGFYYVLPHQIDEVSEHGIFLTCYRSELIRV
jgi:hypothetical protein